MRLSKLLLLVPALPLFGCGSTGGGPVVGASAGGSPGTPAVLGGPWAPAPPTAGYTRLTARTITAVPPGGDVTHCQYLAAPLDRDMDILGVLGYQSQYIHHATAFEYTPKADEPLGNDFQCMGSEFSGDPASLSQMGPFLGAVGVGGKASTSSLPDGVSFRHKKGKGIMLSVHVLNTGDMPVDGNAVLDMNMVESEPSRTIATMFANVSTNVTLPAAQQTTSVVDCVVRSDLSFLMMGNHMHEYGVKAFTQVIRAGGVTEDMHTDDTWSNDQSFNPVYSSFPLATPLVVHNGDTIRTSCTWNNSTPNAILFPREMCTASGFILTPDGSAPMCFNGLWLAQSP